MPLFSRRASKVLLLVLSVAAAENSVQFFYSPLLDSCEWGASNTFTATNNTGNGGLCAYLSSTNRLYACPAPDPTCWTWNQNCKGGTNTPSSDQILCGSSNGYQWCCASYETCTETPGQINVCISEFANPNAGVSPSAALEKEYSVLPSSAIGTSIPTITPTAFSTEIVELNASATSSSSTTSATGSSPPSPSSPSFSPSATSTSSPAPSSSSSSGPKGLSGRAAAGIAVGVFVGISGLAGIAIFLFLRKRRQGANMAHEKDAKESALISHEMDPQGDGQNGQTVKPKVAQIPPQEMPVIDSRQELPG